MQTRGRRLRFTAVLVLVVLALTGFSSGRGRGGSHGHRGGGSGGGCSSSSQDHDSSRSSTSSGGAYGSGGSSGGSYRSDDDDDYSGSSSSSGGSSYTRRPGYGSTPTSSSGSGSRKALKDGTARLVSCATPAAPYATVEVSNPNGRKADFSVSVTFEDDRGITVVSRYGDVTVPANGRATVDVRVGGSGLVDSVDHCEVDRQALVDD
ncbi:hypothetical protein ABZ408_18835 [Streptomyces tibetensis]|uniref:Secreted protein n=1 Tax=Streptomyces tibetensis TaxID=2382123 RepID=A0ABW6N0I3_9ACTN